MERASQAYDGSLPIILLKRISPLFSNCFFGLWESPGRAMKSRLMWSGAEDNSFSPCTCFCWVDGGRFQIPCSGISDWA